MIFEVFRGGGGGGVKGQKIVQNEKKLCLSHSISQDPYIIWLSFMVHLCKIMISPYVFFLRFFQILIFGINGAKKGKKGSKWQLCLSHSMSQEAYIIWSWFLVHMCKMMTSADAFVIFPKFWFSVKSFDFHFSKVLIFCKRAKNGPKWLKTCICLTLYLSSYTCVKEWYLQQFFSFFENSDFSG